MFLAVPAALMCNGHLVGRSRDGVSGAGLLVLPLCVNSSEAPQRTYSTRLLRLCVPLCARLLGINALPCDHAKWPSVSSPVFTEQQLEA